MRNVRVKNADGLAVMNEGALASEFEARFWPIYPKREAKKAALKAYAKARGEATAEQIEIAVAQYMKHKPTWQNYALPASWLNAGRYFDEYDTPKMIAPVVERAEIDDYHLFRRQAVERQKASA